MSTELIEHEDRAVELAPRSMLEVIYQIAVNPGVQADKMHSILDFQLRVEARDAEKAYGEAFAALQAELPNIVKDGKISLGTKGTIPFATFENVMMIVGPLLKRHGFSYGYTSDDTASGVLMTLAVRHKAGHTQTSQMRLPPDPGPGRNSIQAIGSSRSYAKRYLMLDLLCIVTVGEDDDAKSSGKVITSQQTEKLISLMIDAKVKESSFLEWAGVPTLAQLPENKFMAAVSQLRTIQAAKAKAAQK